MSATVWIVILIGSNMISGSIGFLLCAMINVAKQSDEQMEDFAELKSWSKPKPYYGDDPECIPGN